MQQNNDLNFEPQDVNIVNPKQARKAVVATGIGNAMEWFDFGLYAYLAVILSQLFFSGVDNSWIATCTYIRYICSGLPRSTNRRCIPLVE